MIARAQLGQIEEGLSEMLRWQTYAKTAGGDPAYFTSVGIAEAHLAAGRAREGLEAVAKAIANTPALHECELAKAAALIAALAEALRRRGVEGRLATLAA